VHAGMVAASATPRLTLHFEIAGATAYAYSRTSFPVLVTLCRAAGGMYSTRIYLMGHSMGGYGTWSIAMNHPEIFAALGPISGGGTPAGMVKISHIPEYVVHGDDDRTVPVTQSRNMVEAGKKAGAEIVYVEVPGGSHVGVAAPAFAGMLDFFARQKRAERQ